MDASRLRDLPEGATLESRHQQGVRDGRAGRPKMLDDANYDRGYVHGQHQRTGADTELVRTGTPSVSSFHGA